MTEHVEELMLVVAAMDREELIRQFRSYRGRFPVDLTMEFLQTEPVERLQHIFLALCLQTQHFPRAIGTAA